MPMIPPQKIKSQPWEKSDKYDRCNKITDEWHKWIDKASIEDIIHIIGDPPSYAIAKAEKIRKLLKGE